MAEGGRVLLNFSKHSVPRSYVEIDVDSLEKKTVKIFEVNGHGRRGKGEENSYICTYLHIIKINGATSFYVTFYLPPIVKGMDGGREVESLKEKRGKLRAVETTHWLLVGLLMATSAYKGKMFFM